MIPGTWREVSIAALLIFVLLAAAVSFRPKRRNRRVRRAREIPEVARRPWPIADYSDQYRKHVERLGSRYLLAKPINRRSA